MNQPIVDIGILTIRDDEFRAVLSVFADGHGIHKGRHREYTLRTAEKSASPKWNFDDATFSRTAAAFDNPDHVSIVIHNYRWRLSLAEGERRYEDLEQKLSQGPVVSVPAITIASDFDGPAKDGTAYAKKFSGKYSHRILKISVITCRKKRRKRLRRL